MYRELLHVHDIKLDVKEPLRVTQGVNAEIWWDMKVKMPRGVKHTKPDILVWDKSNNVCQIIDISVPLNVNIAKKCQEKMDSYVPLAAELQRIYKDYSYNVVPIVIGSLGIVTKDLGRNLMKIGVEKDRVSRVVKDIQKRTLIGSMKVVRTFMKMKED